MSRRTHGIRTASVFAGGMVALGLLGAAGCAQQAATAAAASATQVATAAVASAVTTTATGQSATTPATPAPQRAPGVKPNGRGGFDASNAQKAALTRAHWMRDHHNEAFKPYRPTTQPTSQPTVARH